MTDTESKEVEELAKDLHSLESFNSNPAKADKAWEVCHDKDYYRLNAVKLYEKGYTKRPKTTTLFTKGKDEKEID